MVTRKDTATQLTSSLLLLAAAIALKFASRPSFGSSLNGKNKNDDESEEIHSRKRCLWESGLDLWILIRQ